MMIDGAALLNEKITSLTSRCDVLERMLDDLLGDLEAIGDREALPEELSDLIDTARSNLIELHDACEEE